MRVLVCGGRDYNNAGVVWHSLTDLAERHGPLFIIQGGATGADTLAKEWAQITSSENIEFPAEWEKHGKAAGPIRNKRMIVEGKPDLVVAFPGGKGTANMVKLAEEAGIKVLKIETVSS